MPAMSAELAQCGPSLQKQMRQRMVNFCQKCNAEKSPNERTPKETFTSLLTNETFSPVQQISYI